MGKTIICDSRYCHYSLVFVHGHHVYTCICTEVSKNSRFSTVYVHKESSLVWLDPFLARGVYRLQYKHPAKAPSMVIMLLYVTMSMC